MSSNSSNTLSKNPYFVTLVDEWRFLGSPKQNGIDWQLEPWLEKFPEQGKFLKNLSFENLGIMDRDLVYKVVHHELDEDNFLNAFLAVMIWGYAADSRGPFRTNQIIEQAEFLPAISKATESLRQNKIKDAFDTLVTNGPKHLGTAFASKFLYFASRKSDSLRPVILDSLVSKGLEKWSDFRINPLNATSEDYLHYLNYLKTQSDEIGINIEELEFLLFSETARLNGNQTWANRSEIDLLSWRSQMAWGMLFAAELMMRDQDLWLSFTQPAGGQYQCLTLRKNVDDLIINLNLDGSILITGDANLRFDWNHLLQKGVVHTAYRLTQEWKSIPPEFTQYQYRAAYSVRIMADWLLTGQATEVVPIITDSSYSGIQVNNKELLPFKELLNRSERPNHLIYSSEIWLWLIKFSHGEKRLYDIYNAEVMTAPDAIKFYLWPF